MSGSYFEGTFPALEEALEAHFGRMKTSWQGISGKSVALVLGGGYGRGEGGVMDIPTGPALFNDLDYFLFTPSPDDPELAAWCHAREREETAALGVDVEIKRLPAAHVGEGLETMMFADLVAGHVAVAGDTRFLEELREKLDFGKVGVAEATRLLWNRGTGLFLARARIPADLPYVVRNHAKLKLALGDAWLCLAGQYIPRCRERGKRFAACELPAALEQLRAWHLEAVEFKFRPVVPDLTAEALEEESKALAKAWARVFIMVEGKRLGVPMLDVKLYLKLPRLYPEVPRMRALALGLRDKLKRGAFLRPLGDYPRGSLMRALPCLLGLEGFTPADAGNFLPAPAAGEDWQTVYSRWWQHYS